MPFEIKMPQLGLTMETGTVLQWLVEEGDRFTQGQEILEVETDKVAIVVEAHEEGILERILVPVGRQVPVGVTLAIAVAPGETLPADWRPAHPSETLVSTLAPALVSAPSLPSLSATGGLDVSWKARVMARQAGLDLQTLVSNGSGPGGRIVAEDVARALAAATLAPAPAPTEAPKASPVAAKLAASLGLDLSRIAGGGAQERITQTDVLEATAALIRERAPSRPVAAPGPGDKPVLSEAEGLGAGPAQVASVIPLTSVRGIVSERMANSAHTTASVTLFRKVDATALIDLRERFQSSLPSQGVRVSYNDILVRVCAATLREHPDANARMGDGQIERLDRIHIGLAVDTDRGLLVPVIHDADTLTIPQIATESTRLIEAARSGRSLPDDLGGGTFTITNMGMLGVEGFTPVINLPECCILGVGRIVREPVVINENDTVAVRPMMTLSLVFDHRVIDGAPAARFLDRIAQLVQDPLLLL